MDLLVARSETQRLTWILAELGFKRCLSSAPRSYPGIESHIGFDPHSGRLVHLHLHYQLTLGERYLKGYRIPWEHLLLTTRILATPCGVYVTDPHVELLLLVLRASLKLRARDRIRALLGMGYTAGGVQQEFTWLARRVERAKLLDFARRLVGDRAAERLEIMLAAGKMEVASLASFRSELEPPSDEYRTFTPWDASGRRWIRELASRRSGRRRLPQGGMLIALVGADGSGKSTLVAELARWLSPHLDIALIYFGSGGGPASTLRRGLRFAVSLVNSARRSVRTAMRPRHSQDPSAIRAAARILRVTSLARERTRRAAEARRARNRGVIVLCDRFPQSHFTINDGPTLRQWHEDPSPIRRAAAERELKAIFAAERVRPDLVIRLNVTPEVALRRKPDTPPELLRAKLDAVRQLRFSPPTALVEVDATLPLAPLLLQLKQEIWARL